MTGKSPLAFDKLVDALADVHRRRLLVALLDHNPQDESVVIADSDDDADTTEQLVMIRHLHLPKLADLGLIEWDSDARQVEKGPNFDQIRPLLETVDNNNDELPEDWT